MARDLPVMAKMAYYVEPVQMWQLKARLAGNIELADLFMQDIHVMEFLISGKRCTCPELTEEERTAMGV